MTKRPILVAVVSDVHAGSTVAVCPPEGVRLDDGGTYRPSKPQVWLWERWEAFWRSVEGKRKALRADLWIGFNGDCVEGDHHGTTQIISRNPDAQDYVAGRVFGVPAALTPERLFVIRGTETHVGSSGSAEEGLAKRLHAERDPETRTWSWWRLRVRAHDRLLDFQHHGRNGGRPWTQHGAVGNLAAQIAVEHVWAEEEVPDLAFRSHRHVFGDSGIRSKPRVLQTPAWQLKTAHAHKVVPESIADVGGVLAVIASGAPMQVEPVLYRPALPRIV